MNQPCDIQNCTEWPVGIRRDVCRGFHADGTRIKPAERRAWLTRWGYTPQQIKRILKRRMRRRDMPDELRLDRIRTIEAEYKKLSRELPPPTIQPPSDAGTPTVKLPPRSHGCGGCRKRKTAMNRTLPGAGSLVEAITKHTGIKRLVDAHAEDQYQAETQQLLDDAEIIVKSFRRHGRLKALIESVRTYYPELPIRVVDDSFPNAQQTNAQAEKCKAFPGVTWHQLPYDAGLSAGRNYAVQHSPAKWLILCDDDYLFTQDTDLGALLVPLAHDHADLCGGLMRMDGITAVNWCGQLSQVGDTIHLKRLDTPFETIEHNIRIQRTDITFNFFAARREMLLDVPWDEQFKISSEHLDFFLRAHQSPWRCCYTLDSIATHNSKRIDRRYTAKRKRDYSPILLKKWNAKDRKTIGWTTFPNL